MIHERLALLLMAVWSLFLRFMDMDLKYFIIIHGKKWEMGFNKD